MAAGKLDKDSDELITEAYDKLAEFKKKKGLNVLYAINNQQNFDKLMINNLNNM